MYKAYRNGELFWQSDTIDQNFSVLSAELSMEVNKAGSFTFQVPSTNVQYNNFSKFDFIDLERDGYLLWSGRLYSELKDFELVNTEVCEGILAVLNDSVSRPFTHSGTLEELIEALITSHNQQVEATKQITVRYLGIEDSSVYREYTAYASTWERISDLIDIYGGVLTLKKIDGVLTLDWIDSFQLDNNQTIDFGQNLIDIAQASDIEDIATVILPLGAEVEQSDGSKERLTIASVNSNLDYIEDAEAVTEFGRIVKIVIWDEVTQAANLKVKAQAYLEDAKYSKLSINAAAIDLANAGEDIDHFEIGKSVSVKSAAHGIDHSFRVNVIKLNLLDPTQDQLTLGAVVRGYVERTQRANSEYYQLIQKVYANYALNTTLKSISYVVESHTSSIQQNAEAIALRVTSTELESAIADIKVGGRNLMLATGTTKTAESTGASSTDLDPWTVSPFGKIVLEGNTADEFSVSFDYEVTGDFSGSKYDPSGSSYIYYQHRGSATDLEKEIEGTGSGRFEGAFKQSAAQASSSGWLGQIKAYNLPSGCTLTVTNFKLEEGNKVTSWTPAPEDVASRISSAETLIQQNADAILLRATQTDIDNAVADIRIGSVNLLSGSRIENYSTDTLNVEDYVKNGYVQYTRAADTTGRGIYIADSKYIEANTEYVIHFFAAKDAESAADITNVKILVPSEFNTTGKALYMDGQLISDGVTVTSISMTDTTAHEFTFFFKTGTLEETNTHGLVLQFNYGVSNSYTVNITWLKFEKGNKVTSWSPCPDDVMDWMVEINQASLTVTNNRISTLVEKTVYEQGIENVRAGAAGELNDYKEYINENYRNEADTNDYIAGEINAAKTDLKGTITQLSSSIEQTAENVTVRILNGDERLTYLEVGSDGFYIGADGAEVKIRQTAGSETEEGKIQFVEVASGKVLAEFNTGGLIAAEVETEDQIIFNKDSVRKWSIRKGAEVVSGKPNLDDVWIGG